eukprot:11144788-Alexandrium_andersonii.AAC.1
MAHRPWASASSRSSLDPSSRTRPLPGSSAQRWPATTLASSVASVKRCSGSGTARAQMPQR